MVERAQQGGSAMKAVGVIRPDYTPRLFDIDAPVASRGGVVVKVLAASVNDFDRAAVEGRMGFTSQLDTVLLGRDFVGRVTAVGDDVDYIDVGMYVAGTMEAGRSGTFTDLVEVPAELLAPVPDGIDVAQAAGVGLAGITALDAVGALGATDLGTTVIQGSVTEAGGLALQLAKARGAVVLVVTPPGQADLAWALGADVVIPECADATQTIQAVRHFFGGGVDNAIHLAGDISVAASVVRRGGKFTSVALTAPQTTHSDAEYIPTTVVPSGHKLADLLFKVAAHRLHSYVGRTYSFDQVGDAVNSDRSNAAGRTVVVR
jgi:NADPH:quinone reductase-like Zn-dependent oxidoreductase